MNLDFVTKTCLVFAVVFACVSNASSSIADDVSKATTESGNCAINGVEDLAQLIWAVLDAIEREHFATPERAWLMESVAQVLSGQDDGPELDAAMADLIHCHDVHEFVDHISQSGIGDRQTKSSLDQFAHRIITALEAKVGHLRLIPEKESVVEEQLRNNRYVGIGVTATPSGDGKLMFPVVLPGGPAERGGLKNGVIVEEIDGRPTRKVPLETSIGWIRGPAGTEVTLKIADADSSHVFRNVTLKRGVIRMDSVLDRNGKPLSKGTIHCEEDQRIGFVSINDITSSTLSELRAADVIARIEGIRVLVLEFKSASDSSDLHQARLVADALIDGGTLWFQTERGEQPRPEIADRECLFRGIPIVVLLHEYSGAALSAVAAALQDAGRAKIVGDSSQFRGTFPGTVRLAGVPFTLELTTAKLTRTRRGQQWPLQPDHPVKRDGPAAAWQAEIASADAQQVIYPTSTTEGERLEQPPGFLQPFWEALIPTAHTASALFPANVRFKLREEEVAFRHEMEKLTAIKPLPLIHYPNAERVAGQVARDLLNALPESFVE